MKTRELIEELVNKSTEHPEILDYDVVIPCDGGCGDLPVYYVEIEDNYIRLDY